MRRLALLLNNLAPASVYWVFVFLVLIAGVTSPLLHSADEAAKQKKAQQELKDIQKKITNLQNELLEKKGAAGKLEKELRETEKEISNHLAELEKNKSQIADDQKQLAQLELQKKNTLAEVQSERSALVQQIRSAYLVGRQPRLKLLFNQENPFTVSRSLIYLDYLNRARDQRIQELASSLAELETVESDILAHATQLEQLNQSLTATKEKLESSKQKHNTVLASLKSDISRTSNSLEQLTENEKALTKLIESLREAMADVPGVDQKVPFLKLKGKLPWPAAGKHRHRYGEARTEAADNLKWQGVFIAASAGTNVQSIYHGRVVFADWMRGYGLLIIVDHGKGFMSLYGHNQSIFKKPGESVLAGERLGQTGRSGESDHAGVYFEIRQNGKPVNPATWCKKPS